MEYSEQVVAVLSKCVVDVCRQMIAEYDIQVDKKLKNIVITGDNIKNLSITGENLGSGIILGQNIAAGTITGKNIVTQSLNGDLIIDGTLSGVKIKDGTVSANAIKADEMTTTIMNAVVANIKQADIDWADIGIADIGYANIIQAMIDTLNAGEIDADELKASLAQIQSAVIGMADIDLAQIKTLNANDALMQKIVTDKAFLDNLRVGNANIIELYADKVMVKGDDGKYYALIPDGENVLSEQVQIEGGALIDGTVSNTAMTANSITVHELNVSEMSANEAFLLQLSAGIARFGQLFANEAFLGQLRTHLIQSDYLTIKIRDDLQWTNGQNILNNTSKEQATIVSSDLYSQIGTIDISEKPEENQKMACRVFLAPQKGDWCLAVKYGFILDQSLLGVDKIYIGMPDGNVIRSGDSGWSQIISTLPNNVDSIDVYLKNVESVQDAQCIYHSAKAQYGEMCTAWTPSIDDQSLQYEAQLTIRDSQISSFVEDKVNGLRTEILEGPDSIASAVSNVEGEFTNLIQTVNGLDLTIGQQITQLNSTLTLIQQDLNTNFAFNSDGLYITRGDFSVRITPTKMGFYEKGTQVAYISNNKLYITHMESTNSLKIGNLTAVVDGNIVTWS